MEPDTYYIDPKGRTTEKGVADKYSSNVDQRRADQWGKAVGFVSETKQVRKWMNEAQRKDMDARVFFFRDDNVQIRTPHHSIALTRSTSLQSPTHSSTVGVGPVIERSLVRNPDYKVGIF
jgi:hypothetical protein